MSEEEPRAGDATSSGGASRGGGERGAPASTPFDNPMFLPVLLWLFAAWFGYDTFVDTEAGREWPWFNRIGFVVALALAIYYSVQARRARQREASPPASDGSGGE